MKIIILPGNSSENKQWIEHIQKELKSFYKNTEILYYSHWKKNNSIINIKEESKKLTSIAQDDSIIFAKSAGILVALQAIKEGLNPSKCVYIGMPIIWAKENNLNLEKLLTNHITPTLFVQQEKDFLGSYSQLRNLLLIKNVRNYKIEKVKGNDHNYNPISKIIKLTNNFIQE